MTLLLSIAGFIGAGLVLIGLFTRSGSGLRLAIAGAGLLALVVFLWAVALPLIRGITSAILGIIVAGLAIGALSLLFFKRLRGSRRPPGTLGQ